MLDTTAPSRRQVAAWTAFICLLCSVPYWRALSLPRISDTYLQIWLGRKYLGISTWPDLAADALYRCRATSIWMTGAMDYLFGSSQLAVHLQSLSVHLLNVALIAALGVYRPLGYRLMIPAALIWGFTERHHEAVMWYAALPEQLVFAFVLLSLQFWLRWWETGERWQYAACLLSFVLALLSKESGVVVCGLMAMPLLFEPGRWRRAAVAVAPFLVLSAIYFYLNMAAKQDHLHWNDGTFKLGWHFLPVMGRSIMRLLSVFGAAALLWLWWQRRQVDWKTLVIALLWMPITLAPYSFVAYQPRVPSRHVYLASVGLALLLSLALMKIPQRRLANGLLAAYLAFNAGYIWFYKHDQFVARAQVTEQVVADARALVEKHGERPLQVTCFPLGPELASIAVNEHLGLPEEWVAVHYSPDPKCGPVRVEPIFD